MAYLQCGPLKEVRLVKNRAGKSKGFAYIEYLSEVCVYRLIKGHQLRQITIATIIKNRYINGEEGMRTQQYSKPEL